MGIIYEPKGAAREYSPLAANLYRGCGHGCKYCYAPSCLRMASTEFHGNPQPRAGVLEQLRKDVSTLEGDSRRVLLCFTCDPYQPIEEFFQLTRKAIEIIGQAHLPIRVLTKNPRLALRDLKLFKTYDVEFGVSLSWVDDQRRRKWEPIAGTVAERIDALKVIHDAGVRTWLSVEPVIDPAEALGAMNATAGTVDLYKIGKLNHDKQREVLIDWRAFLHATLETMNHLGADYYIKNDLWAWADAAIELSYFRERITGRSDLMQKRKSQYCLE